MINSPATWLLPQANILDDQLVFLYPDLARMQAQTELLMVAVLASPADSDITVNLSSDQPSRVSVPASILIPTGESEGTFVATSGTVLGQAVISATVVETVQSTITVIAAHPDLRPTPVRAKELKPRPITTEES